MNTSHTRNSFLEKALFFWVLATLFLVGIACASVAHAEEYTCTITATKAAGCEAYASVSHTCLFPDELNDVRTAEAQTGKYTYPEFCSVTCAEESTIPKKCRAGRIGVATRVIADTPLVVAKDNAEPEVPTKVDLVQKNTIFQNAFEGAKIAFGKFWNWLKEASAGKKFEIENKTETAGVRG